MAVFRVLGDELVTSYEYLQGIQERPELSAALEATATDVTEGAATSEGVTQFVPIGLGKPLTILMREVYTGKHPTKVLFGGAKQMLVTSALKGYAAYAPASRAVNFAEPNIAPHRRMAAPMATSAGTNVVAYSPGILTEQLNYTVEMAFDRFPDGLLTTIGSVFTSAASIPILLPAREYLLAAGSLVKIGSDWADALIDGTAAFAETDTIYFDIPGVEPAKADFRVLGAPELRDLKYKPGTGLVTATGQPYDGDFPYVVISLDGAERKSLESFAPTLATAEQLKKFLNAKDGAEASIEALLNGMKIANDIAYRQEALKLQKTIADETDEAKKKAMTIRLEALKKNILTPELKPA